MDKFVTRIENAAEDFMFPKDQKNLMSANTGFLWKWSNKEAISDNEQVELALPKIKLPDNRSKLFVAPPINIYFNENTGIYRWSTPLEA